ncbi:PAS domain S-box protein [Clostridium sp. YIM B02515]|uniref:histidine kinase n=1 Tax=Clostridium rhizosphaerae TaxID=2803861 RepID=A0ABS1TD30_9CLOT|nr:PAS domain S-box protein [Clostridium rhizosphaerae]
MNSFNTEIRNSLIAECISDFIWEMDLIENKVYVSEAWKEFLGYDDDLYFNSGFWYSIIHPKDVEAVVKSTKDHINGKIPYHESQYRIKTKNEGYKWIYVKAKAHYNDNEIADYISGFNIDISAIKKIEQNENEYRTLFNGVNDAVFLSTIDKETLKEELVELNDSAVRLTGFSKGELIGEPINNIRTSKIKPEEELNKQKALDPNTVYTSLLSKDKHNIPVEISTTFFEKDEVIMKLEVVRDISDRIQVQRKLEESEERYRNIVELSPNGAFIQDNGRIIFVNDNGVKLLDAPSKEAIIGKNVKNFIHPKFHDILNERMKTVGEGKQVHSIEIMMLKHNGDVIYAEVSPIPMIFNGKIYTLSIAKDITEKKIIQEENQKLINQTLEYDRLKTEFFANISHELRTPLNVIISSIQLLNDTYGCCNDKLGRCFSMNNRYMNVMKQNSYRLLKLINNLIDITRIDSGFYKVNLNSYNIVEIIENITLSVVPYAEQKGIEVIFDTDFEEKFITCDEEKIERILLNLLSNSIKFTPTGGNIKVNIGESEDSIRISVRDTGSGIPEDKLEVIFERFRQVDEVLTKRAEGSGIGLALVKALVEISGGKISVWSKIGEGSEFLIELPKKISNYSTDIVFTNISNLEENKKEKINIELSDIYV